MGNKKESIYNIPGKDTPFDVNDLYRLYKLAFALPGNEY